MNNKLKLIVVSVLARVRYGHNLMSITHKVSSYITLTMKVVAMTISPLASSALKHHNTLNSTILFFYEPPITKNKQNQFLP
jgi:hypothetical protein